MRAFAPGKLVLTGAYAVLDGAPAIAIAVSRGAIADTSRIATTPTPEVLAAVGASTGAPHVDASAMFATDRKLGLGASAAILVASIAALEAEAGADLSDAACRDRLFARARAAHARAQGGGSGVDVATSIHGGAIRYVVGAPVQRVALPAGVRVDVFALTTSAKTHELRAAVDALRHRDEAAHRWCLADLKLVAVDAANAIDAGDAATFIEMLRQTARALARLGASANVGIVPDGFDALEALATREDASFSVSGAGGGDVAVFVGRRAPSAAFLEGASALGLTLLDVTVDDHGVRVDGAASVIPETSHVAPPPPLRVPSTRSRCPSSEP